MSASEVVPQVLEHVDVDRWGPRKAELLLLVAKLQDSPNPVPLGRKLLEAMGRSARQARYDHDVLIGLAEDRVLIRWRGAGRSPDCWAVADVDRWRGVAWITPRRQVVRAFSGPEPGAGVVLWTKRAAHAARLRTNGPLLEALGYTDLSVERRITTPRPPATTPRTERENRPPLVHNATALGAPSPMYLESEFTPSLTPLEGTEGGRECADTNDPGAHLLAAVRRSAQTSIFGVNADRIRAVGRAHPDQLDDLLHFAGMLSWVRTGTGAAQAVEDYAAELASAPTVDPRISQDNQRAYLERMLAIEERDGGDHEVIEQLRSQLTSLGQA